MREVRCKLKYLKVLACLAGVLAGATQTVAAPPEVAVSRDLRSDARAAQARALPILLSFSSDHCGYCELLEEDFLRPMLISGDYEDKVLIRKININDGRTLFDFEGRAVDADRLASRYRIRAVPTVLFLDAQGRELAERMVGINTTEFYGGYLDNNIETALLRVRAGASQ